MQKEVEIYKDLADIQGECIPKLVCYEYYGGGMSFVIGMTIVDRYNAHFIKNAERNSVGLYIRHIIETSCISELCSQLSECIYTNGPFGYLYSP
ncbi:kinase-like domain-containing protein [Rhizophagus irregularis DAOM 181602=DAOM 197198]|nr:kinase-like domain-containing protein [Rhizophagus irregularis DAOM 181602=DAOM 197198]